MKIGLSIFRESYHLNGPDISVAKAAIAWVDVNHFHVKEHSIDSARKLIWRINNWFNHLVPVYHQSCVRPGK